MTDTRQQSRPPLVLTRLWENTGAKGDTYPTGRLGATRVPVMQNRDRAGAADATHASISAEAGGREDGR